MPRPLFRQRVLLPALLALVMTVILGSARAQPAPAAPAQTLDLAHGLFDRELWGDALAKYEAFITASPKSTQLPTALFRAGECLFKLERLDEALARYQRLTTEFPQAEEALHGWYRSGEVLFRQGKSSVAAAAYGKVLELNPKSPLAGSAAYWRGEALFRQGDIAEAIGAYEKCLTLNPEANLAAYAAYSIGLAKIRAGDLKGATERLEGVLKRYPQHDLIAEVLYLLGEAAFLGKNYDAAGERYAQVIKDYPQSRFALLARSGQGRRLCAAGKYVEALPLFQAVAAGQDAEAAREANLRAGDCLFLLGRYGEAAQTYAAVADGPADANSALARFWQATSLERQADKPAARTAFEKFVTAYPDHERAGEALLHLGDLQAEANAFAAAEKSYRAAAEKVKDVASQTHARYGAAWAAYQQDQSEARLAEIEKIATEAPKTAAGAQAAYQVGKLRLSRQEYSRAIQLLSQLVQTHPQDANLPESLYLLGAAYELAGNAAKAKEFYGRCQEQYAQTSFAAEALARLTILTAREGQLKPAQELLAKLLTVTPSEAALAAARLALADTLYARKNYPAALEQYQAVLAAKSGDNAAEAQYGLGACYLAQGDHTRAVEAFRTGVQKFPQATNARATQFQLAAALQASGDQAGAVKQYEALLAADAKGDLADETLLELGTAYGDLKQSAKAAAAFTRLLQDFPASPYAAEARFRLAEVRFDEGDFAAAQKAYEQLLAEHQDSSLTDEANYKLGWSLLKLDKPVEATAAFRVAAAKAEDPAVQADARYQLALLLLKQNHAEEAVKVLEVLRQKPPAGLLASTTLLLGQAYLTQKDFTQAAAVFKDFLTKFAEDALAPRAQLGLGRALKGEKKFDEAVTVLTRATGVPDKQVAMEAQFDLAETRNLQGDARAAAMEYLKVAILYNNPEWGARAQFAAGLCYERAQAVPEAIKAYKGVVDLYKNQTEWVQKAQERLRALE